MRKGWAALPTASMNYMKHYNRNIPSSTELLIDILKAHGKVQLILVAISRTSSPAILYASSLALRPVDQNKITRMLKWLWAVASPTHELRSLSDPRVFEFYDFITLDDGEAPIRTSGGII